DWAQALVGAGLPANAAVNSTSHSRVNPLLRGLSTSHPANSGQKKPRTSYGEGEVRGPSPDR
ncbi:MAG TPA: hypothetical protein DD418_11910, partial [Pseudomonas sp.]|nr:hypothetical protein [Pseudomonas sp.]